MPTHNATRRIPPLVLTAAAVLSAACGGGDAVEPRPDPPSNRAPAVAAAIPDQALIAGQTITADVAGAFTDPDGDALTYAARSSNAAVANAALSGSELSLTGVAPGAAAITLTAMDPGGLSASQSFAVEVMAPTPTGLTITPASAAFTAIGQTAQMSVEVVDQQGQPISNPSVTWSSADGAVATVDASGLVTAAGNGETTVTATSGAASGSTRLTVNQVATSVALSPAADTLTALGDTLRLTAEAVDANGHVVANATFTWSSADASVVAVDETGLATAVANGSARVTAASGTGASAASGTAALVVAQRAAAVAVSPATATLALGDTVRLTAAATDGNGHALAAAAFDWTSSNATVASVDDRGLVRARAEGTATVTAVSGGAEGAAAITVGPPQPPPDLGGAYTLHSIVGAATGGAEFVHPAASGTLELTQDAPSGGSASGRYTVNVTTPVTTITDQGTFTVHADGRWAQTGQVSGEGAYAVSGDSLTIAIATPATAVSTTVWVRGYPPTPGMWRGLVVAPEARCSEYDVGDYEHSDNIVDAVVRALGGKLYEPYTGIYYDHAREVQVDHIIAKVEAHDSGACAWRRNDRRDFVNDLDNLALATPRLDRGVKAERDAAEWLPDFNQCWYANAVVAVRRKYALTIDEAERDALEAVLADCDDTEMVLAPESWAIEPMTLGGESGWRARSPHEPDDGDIGVVGDIAVACTATFISADFRFLTGGARFEGSEENYEAGPLRYTTKVSPTWAVPPASSLDMLTVHQDPRTDTWTARLDPRYHADFFAALGTPAQRLWMIWPLPTGNATIQYEAGPTAGETIRDILQRCAAP